METGGNTGYWLHRHGGTDAMKNRDMGDLDQAVGVGTGIMVVFAVAIFIGLLVWSVRMLWVHLTGTSV